MTLEPLQENLNEANFVYGLTHSSSQIISGSPLLDALGEKSSWSSSSWKNKSTDEPGVQRAKKTSWYNALYPSYKSRSEDFKKIFTTLPSNERLIVGKLNKSRPIIEIALIKEQFMWLFNKVDS